MSDNRRHIVDFVSRHPICLEQILAKVAGDEAFYAAYARLVELVRGRVLGGGRFAAEKP
jgi:hypothetical protein